MTHKNIGFAISYIIGVFVLILITDIIYSRYLERIPPLQEEVYLQMAESATHRRSQIRNLFYELKPNAQNSNSKINSLGMRDCEPHIGKDCYRVLVMGDSVTFGFEVKQDQLFTEKAEQILNSDKIRAEILNAGVCGYNTKQEAVALKEKYLNLNPDMVIFAYCINDIGDAGIQYLPEEPLQRGLSKSGIEVRDFHYKHLSKIRYLSLVLPIQIPINHALDRWLLLHSGIYRAISLCKFKIQYGVKDFKNLSNFVFAFNFDETLAEINTLSKNKGFLLRFVILPTVNQWDRSGVIKSFLNNNIKFWDLDSELKQKYSNISQMFLNGDVHLTIEGHVAVGKLLAEKIKAELL